MSQSVFKRADLRYLANALAERQTHSGISTFELGLGLNTEGSGSKAERASTILRHVFSQPDADELIVQMLNHVFVENPYANTSVSDSLYATLKSNVLDPRGVSLTDDGFTLPGDFASSDERTTSQGPPGGAVRFSNTTHTAILIGEAPSTPAPAPHAEPSLEIDARKVFVVHGRDHEAVAVVEQFLLYVGLEMMAWSDAVARTGKTQPHTFDIVTAGMASCAAVIVLFSPDDLARVKDEFSEAGDPDRKPRGQARQNVLLEAGMAFAVAPDRTIFVKSAHTREISDIAGFNWVTLDGRWDSRKDLKERLIRAHATVRAGDYDLNAALAGPFCVPRSDSVDGGDTV